MSEPHSNKDKVVRRVLYSGLVILAAIGAISAILRSVSVALGGWTYEQVQLVAPAYLVEEAFEIDRWFATNPKLSLLHVVPGGLFLVLASFQFSPSIRTRHIQFHRWLGRMLVFSALPIGVTGLILGAIFPLGGPVASAAIFVFGTLFLVAIVRGFAAIRNRDVPTHREWMIRMFAIALGISTVRIIGTVLLAVTGGSFQELVGPSFWIGLAVTFIVGELWIRYTRQRRVGITSAPLSVTVGGEFNTE